MKALQSLFGALAVLVIGMGSGLAAVAPGEKAPDFTLVSAEGKEVSLSDFEGKKVILEWTNHQCPFVRKHYGAGNMQALQKEMTSEGVVWLSIISSAPGKQGYVKPEKARQLTQSRDAHPTHVLLDPTGEVGRMYGAKVTPHMYVMDENRKLVYVGAIDDKPTPDPDSIDTATNFVRAAYNSLEDGAPVEPAYQPPYGCTVKYP